MGFLEEKSMYEGKDKASFVIMPLLTASLAVKQSSGPGLELYLFLFV